MFQIMENIRQLMLSTYRPPWLVMINALNNQYSYSERQEYCEYFEVSNIEAAVAKHCAEDETLFEIIT